MQDALAMTSMNDFLAVALSLEIEAARRYRYLAAWWESRGERELTALFDRFAALEADHAAAVQARNSAVSPAPTMVQSLAPRRPDDGAWHSALLTPYSALALAVDEEERAWAFYRDVAAQAVDPGVRALAEALAREEREHAALLRRSRRAAFHTAVASTRALGGSECIGAAAARAMKIAARRARVSGRAGAEAHDPCGE
jgi:rubrerythrin